MIIAWLRRIEIWFVVYGANWIATNWRLRDACTFQKLHGRYVFPRDRL